MHNVVPLRLHVRANLAREAELIAPKQALWRRAFNFVIGCVVVVFLWLAGMLLGDPREQ